MTLPRYLSAATARQLADEVESAVAQVRVRFVAAGADERGLEHEIMLALARAAVRYGFDLLPTMAATSIERLEIMVAELEAKISAARVVEGGDRYVRDLAGVIAGGMSAAALADEAEPLLDEEPRPRRAPSPIRAVHISGIVGDPAALATTELLNLADGRTPIEFRAAARDYFAPLGFLIHDLTFLGDTAYVAVRRSE